MRSTATRTVVLTRSHEDNAALATSLTAAGVDTIELPCVRTEALDDTRELRAAVRGLGFRDMLVVTSRAGAEAVAGALGCDPLCCPVAAIGPSTARRARSLGMGVSFVASRPDGHTLAVELPLPPGEVVLARSDRADGVLPSVLRDRGARVREIAAYRTVLGATASGSGARAAVENGAVVVVASPSAVDALRDAIGAKALASARFVAIGARTAAHVQERLGAGSAIAASPDVRSLVAAITRAMEVHR